MNLLIFAGLLYLAGISGMLLLKPEIMFSSDGNWKEFGIGRNKEKYTWMPFWLFSIAWAIISYLIVLVIASTFGYITNKTEIPVPTESIESENVSMKSMKSMTNVKGDLKAGYYILDTNETMKKGVPKYIYLGPEAPNVIYNSPNTENIHHQ